SKSPPHPPSSEKHRPTETELKSIKAIRENPVKILDCGST
ncbi:hypothetical protein VN97_g13132, partial [Penicillium thymicola]